MDELMHRAAVPHLLLLLLQVPLFQPLKYRTPGCIPQRQAAGLKVSTLILVLCGQKAVEQ